MHMFMQDESDWSLYTAQSMPLATLSACLQAVLSWESGTVGLAALLVCVGAEAAASFWHLHVLDCFALHLLMVPTVRVQG